MKEVPIGVVVVVVMALLAGVAYVVFSRVAPTAAAATAAPETIIAGLPVVRASEDIVADAVVVPIREAQPSLPTGGIVAEVLVVEGDQVEAGQVLVRLDSALQAAAVAQAEAQVLRAQNTVAELQAGAQPEEIEAARASVELARARLARVEEGARPEEVAAAEAALSAAEGSAGMVEVTVADTGTGVQPENLPYVFERFWRGEKSRSRAAGGSGLGLAIARQLVEMHGGTIGVESTPGEGARFWFTLPAGAL
jgi:multidrug efflux pump subunit AcrA (membrane-fusion protein)